MKLALSSGQPLGVLVQHLKEEHGIPIELPEYSPRPEMGDERQRRSGNVGINAECPNKLSVFMFDAKGGRGCARGLTCQYDYLPDSEPRCCPVGLLNCENGQCGASQCNKCKLAHHKRGFECVYKASETPRQPGASCSSNSACASGRCLGGFCCRSDLDATKSSTGCLACSGRVDRYGGQCSKCSNGLPPPFEVTEQGQAKNPTATCNGQPGATCQDSGDCNYHASFLRDGVCLGGRCCLGLRDEDCTQCGPSGECLACVPDRTLGSIFDYEMSPDEVPSPPCAPKDDSTSD